LVIESEWSGRDTDRTESRVGAANPLALSVNLFYANA